MSLCIPRWSLMETMLTSIKEVIITMRKLDKTGCLINYGGDQGGNYANDKLKMAMNNRYYARTRWWMQTISGLEAWDGDYAGILESRY